MGFEGKSCKNTERTGGRNSASDFGLGAVSRRMVGLGTRLPWLFSSFPLICISILLHCTQLRLSQCFLRERLLFIYFAKSVAGHSLAVMALMRLIPFTASSAFPSYTSKQNPLTPVATLCQSSGTRCTKL